MAILLTKLDVQGWSHLLLQGDSQYILRRPKVYELYTNGSMNGDTFATIVRGVSITLMDEDIARILNNSLGGWDHYFKFA